MGATAGSDDDSRGRCESTGSTPAFLHLFREQLEPLWQRRASVARTPRAGHVNHGAEAHYPPDIHRLLVALRTPDPRFPFAIIKRAESLMTRFENPLSGGKRERSR